MDEIDINEYQDKRDEYTETEDQNKRDSINSTELNKRTYYIEANLNSNQPHSNTKNSD